MSIKHLIRKCSISESGDVVYSRKRHFQPHADDGRTKVSAASSCDINKIMADFRKTGQCVHVNHVAPFYGDATIVPSYEAAFQRVALAHEHFEALPAQVRKHFRNDPRLFLEACSTVEGCRELEKFGLLSVKDMEKLKADAKANEAKHAELLSSLQKAADAAAGGVTQPAK